MKKLLLILLILCALLPSAFAKTVSKRCSEESLRSLLKEKMQKGEVITNLQKKSWWKACPLSIRKKLYSEIIPMSYTSSLPILNKAPELRGLGEWLNSQPLTLASLKGKVVVIDFWTFECINCIRTLPSVQGYWNKYKDKPFVVIGVHTPEFTFEKSFDNLKNAVKKRGLTYPIVQDNDFATWNAYNNRYWPAFYIVDKQGNVRYTHFGEGEYDTMDTVIEDLLKET